MQKNIILLGGSNSVMGDGLQKGIQDSLSDKNEFKLYNFGLGACNAFQNFYELKRKRNKKIFENAVLIITESNVNDVRNIYDAHERVPLDIFYRNLSWFYKELYFLNKKVVSLLLPNEFENYRLINNMHKKLCEKYGFNCIDMQEYYENNALQEFGKRIDWAHQLESIMYRVGQNIIDSIERFQMPKKLTITNDNPKFFECTPKDMIVKKGKIKEDYIVNSVYNEQIYRLDSDTALTFPKKMRGCCLVGLHTWNNTREWKESFKAPTNYDECSLAYASLELCNDIHNGGGGGNLIKETNMLNCMIEIQNPFYVGESTICRLGNNKDYIKEYYHGANSRHENSHKLSFCDIIAFFCATKEGNYHTETLDYEVLSKENIKISTQYDYNHILPPIEKYKKLIDEVLLHKDMVEILLHRDIIIEYLIKTGAKELESKPKPKKETYEKGKNTYFHRLLHKKNIGQICHTLNANFAKCLGLDLTYSKFKVRFRF